MSSKPVYLSRYMRLLTICASSASDHMKLVNVVEASRETTLCLAGAHALVRLDDGTIVGDPMEKTTLDALQWQLNGGKYIQPAN